MKVSVITVGILHWVYSKFLRFVRNVCLFEVITASLLNTLIQFPQIFLTNPSKLRIDLWEVPTVITETLTV